MEWSPKGTWDRLASWLASIDASLPRPPEALLVISAHWEARVPSVTSATAPELIYDYSGFPPHTYALRWPAPGAPELAARAQELLSNAAIESHADPQRGFDHGVFIPLKVAYPDARVPTVQLSLKSGLDPAEHIAIGRALAPLRDEGVLVVGSGMSYHNMRNFMTPRALEASELFDGWLAHTVSAEPVARDAALADWQRAPGARESHPREEHLLPLMVAAGAAPDALGERVFRDQVMGAVVSAVRFG
jgi:aromatic ring-opening dioxygenase catalytic subunit (LigB family)